MKTSPSPSVKALAGILCLTLGVASAHAAVLTLDFANGNGTTSVDQYTGTAGSGWNTAWTTAAGSGVTSSTSTVVNTTPLYTGGGNYLSTSFTVSGTTSTANQWVRVSRQVNSSAISLTSPVSYSFTLRPDSAVQNTSETFTIFNATAATPNTGGSDTWKITADGGGWNIYNGSTIVAVGKVGATNLAGTDYQFTINSDPSTKTWTTTIYNITNNSTYNSGTLSWRNTAATSENTFLNFVSQSGATSSQTFGYSLDNIVVVPEPSVGSLTALAGLSFLLLKRYRRRATLSC